MNIIYSWDVRGGILSAIEEENKIPSFVFLKDGKKVPILDILYQSRDSVSNVQARKFFPHTYAILNEVEGGGYNAALRIRGLGGVIGEREMDEEQKSSNVARLIANPTAPDRRVAREIRELTTPHGYTEVVVTTKENYLFKQVNHTVDVREITLNVNFLQATGNGFASFFLGIRDAFTRQDSYPPPIGSILFNEVIGAINAIPNNSELRLASNLNSKIKMIISCDLKYFEFFPTTPGASSIIYRIVKSTTGWIIEKIRPTEKDVMELP